MKESRYDLNCLFASSAERINLFVLILILEISLFNSANFSFNELMSSEVTFVLSSKNLCNFKKSDSISSKVYMYDSVSFFVVLVIL